MDRGPEKKFIFLGDLIFLKSVIINGEKKINNNSTFETIFSSMGFVFVLFYLTPIRKIYYCEHFFFKKGKNRNLMHFPPH